MAKLDMNKIKTTAKNAYTDVRTHWNTPKEGKQVPYKEYLSVFIGIGGEYTYSSILGLITFGFGAGCYLIMNYYNIPLLAFSAIAAFFSIPGYFWAVLDMIVCDNLGFVPKKTERRLYALYAVVGLFGLAMVIFDFSKLIAFPTALTDYVATLPGMTMRSVLKIFGTHFLTKGYFGIRNIVMRKVFLPKYGRFKFFFYPSFIPCVIIILLICWLPLYDWYANDQAERIWILHLLFCLFGGFGFTGGATNIAHHISTDGHERMLVRCYPEKFGHLFNSIAAAVVPVVAAFTGGLTSINTYKYILPVLVLVSTAMMYLGIRNLKERIPQPPLEKKKYIPFWDGIGGVIKNKYRWINAISGMIDALGNGGLAVKTIVLIYTWRELGIVFVIVDQLVRFVGNPGAFLAPWIRKKFQYKTLVVFKRMVYAIQSAAYIAACWWFKDDYFLCGLIMVIALAVGDMLCSAVKLAEEDMAVRVSDYQMYLSGERLDSYAGVIGWFTGPISALISLIIPILFYRYGFTSDWDVLFVDDIRTKCMIVGVAFDLVGHILCCLPYVFFWDYTDEKHAMVIKTLEERAAAAEAELAAERAAAAGESVAVSAGAAAEIQKE